MRPYRLPEVTGIEALTKVEVPMPKPAYRQVLMKVAACSLNYRDLAICLGKYRVPSRPNLIPLSDGAGEVVEIGPGVTRVKVGDRVAPIFTQSWLGGEVGRDLLTALGGDIDGVLAEYVLLD